MTRGRGRKYGFGVISRFLGFQGLSQVLGVITGLAVIRSLDKVDYAQYALITSMLAAMTLLSESGVTSGLMSRGASIIKDSGRLGHLFSTALRFRRVVGILAIILGDSVLLTLLLHTGASPLMASIYILFVALTFVPILTKGILEPYFRLAGTFQVLQRVTLASGALRLFAVGVLLLGNAVTISSLLFAGLVCAAFEVWQLRRKSREAFNLKLAVNQDDVTLFKSNLLETLPMNLVLVAQGQLLYLFIGFFGSTLVLAEIAALSRLAILFVILNAVVIDIGTGVVARALPNRRSVRRAMGPFLGGFLFLALVIVAIIYIFATPLVWILGPGYDNLQTALVIVAVGTAAINLGDTLRMLNQARGWLKGSWVFVPLTAIWASVGLCLLDLTSLSQAAIFMTLQAVPALATQTVCFVLGYRALNAKAEDIDL